MPAPPAFQPETILVPPGQLVARKQLSPVIKNTIKYRQIKASLQSVGLIEPIVIFPAADDRYTILDGHMRAAILTDLGAETIKCLIATDEEAYTYNKRVNSLSTVQEHQMILKAIKNGVSEERIAAVLNVNVREIRQKRDLLNGICPEAAEMLKNRPITVDAFRILKKMTPYRQVEAADLMAAASNFSVSFASAILAATKAQDLLEPAKKHVNGLPKDQLKQMEEELGTLQEDLNSIKDAYAADALALSITLKYVGSIIGNKCVLQYLSCSPRCCVFATAAACTCSSISARSSKAATRWMKTASSMMSMSKSVSSLKTVSKTACNVSSINWMRRALRTPLNWEARRMATSL